MESNSQEKKKKNCFCVTHLTKNRKSQSLFRDAGKVFLSSLWTINFPDKLYSLAFFALRSMVSDVFFPSNVTWIKFVFISNRSFLIHSNWCWCCLLDAAAAFRVSSDRNGLICVSLQSAFSDNAIFSLFLPFTQYSWSRIFF